MTPKNSGMIFVIVCICALGGVPPWRSCRAWVWRTWYQPVKITPAMSRKYGIHCRYSPCSFDCTSCADQLRFMPRK